MSFRTHIDESACLQYSISACSVPKFACGGVIACPVVRSRSGFDGMGLFDEETQI
jgi:hypothetical protein